MINKQDINCPVCETEKRILIKTIPPDAMSPVKEETRVYSAYLDRKELTKYQKIDSVFCPKCHILFYGGKLL